MPNEDLAMVMRWKLKFAALGIAVSIAMAGLAAGIAGAWMIGRCTHSGLLGICGPYGSASGIMLLTGLAAALLGIVWGIRFARRWYFRRG